ncbi:ATP-binding protein [Streptomyces sp. S1A]|uniref:ATP-binding protein n=1 Tax=Streptomyces sp. ICN903 TaxID=2964654 RepID=UPI001EDBA1B6|nr:ATP-binding protein [Streptomyces sp. ICN903]MCG3040455.1 ATP-binding protein [Streptomyces sp. ICN903]
MDGYGITEPRLRSVLPFRAAPDELSGLRLTVREQLNLWGLADLVDDVEVVAGELAANVVRHVGQDSAATLVLAVGDGRLRLEAHDGSHAVPAIRQPGDYDENGRGLRLLAALAADWGTMLTASGKAVWCEFSLGVKEEYQRLRRAASTLEVYGRISGRLAPTSSRSLAVLEGAATGLIADLLYWMAKQGRDPDDFLDRAQMRYEAESGAA